MNEAGDTDEAGDMDKVGDMDMGAAWIRGTTEGGGMRAMAWTRWQHG